MEREKHIIKVGTITISPEDSGEKIIKDIEILREERRKRIELAHPACPLDGMASDYIGAVGAQTTYFPTYQCPDKHRFSLREGEAKLLPETMTVVTQLAR